MNQEIAEDEIVQFLLRPESYPAPVTAVEHVQTHISHVFLTDQHAYKLRKHVTFDFLDFATVEQRRHDCAEELRINRRLAPEVYLGMLPVVRESNGQLRLGRHADGELRDETGDEAEIVDWVVQMRRLPHERSMSALVAANELQPAMVAALTQRLCSFYRSLPPLELDPAEHLRVMTQRTLANRKALLAMTPDLSATMVQRILAVQLHYLFFRDDWFAARVQAGKVVDGHGDLRLDHIYFLPAPVAIDGIEFNPAFRRIDELDELCFLAMECDSCGAQTTGDLILTHYGALLGDEPPAEFVAHFKTYRACVRSKVAGFRAAQSTGAERQHELELARKLLEMADAYSRPLVAPYMVVVHGLSGTGKSVLSRGVAERLGCELLQTDVIRQEIITEKDVALRYSDAARERVYDEQLQRAAAATEQGIPVVLDGTFLQRSRRERLARFAAERAIPIVFLQTVCDEQLARSRVEKRLRQGSDASEIRPELLQQQRQTAEPDSGELKSMPVDSGGSEAETVERGFHLLKSAFQNRGGAA